MLLLSILMCSIEMCVPTKIRRRAVVLRGCTSRSELLLACTDLLNRIKRILSQIKLDPLNMDILSTLGYTNLLMLALQLHPGRCFAMNAPVCSSWVDIGKSVAALYRTPLPPGFRQSHSALPVPSRHLPGTRPRRGRASC